MLTIKELILEHTSYYKEAALIFLQHSEVRKQRPAVGIHPFLIPERFHSLGRILSFRQKTESDKNTKKHSRTIVQNSDTSRVFLDMLAVSSKDMNLCTLVSAVNFSDYYLHKT
jgi:hypothetical protein